MFKKIFLQNLIERFGSPLYFYDASQIRSQYQKLSKAFFGLRHQIHYAMKANSNPHLLNILLQEGAGIDAVSFNEAFLAKKVGFQSHQILFSGNNITTDEIQKVVEQGWIFNAESLHNIKTYGQFKTCGKISLRLNLDIGAGHHTHCITSGSQSKFGIYHDQLTDALKLVKTYNLTLIGLHVHIGAGITESQPFIQSLQKLLQISQSCPHLKFVDIGGGFGIPYQEGTQEFDVQSLSKQIQHEMQGFEHLELKMEPGRYLVGSSGTLLATVNGVKHTPDYQFVGVDTGMNHLIRPAMYGAYHQIEAVTDSNDSGREAQAVVIAGNICETGDVLNQNDQGHAPILLPLLKQGDLIAIKDCGAYGYSMSSSYNMRGRPAEVLVDGQETKLIRRRETYQDLLALCNWDSSNSFGD